MHSEKMQVCWFQKQHISITMITRNLHYLSKDTGKMVSKITDDVHNAIEVTKNLPFLQNVP